MSKMNITPYITSEDISRLPDQASFKLNTLIDNLTAEMIDREKGDSEGSDALQDERDARINADDNLNAALTEATGDMATAYEQLSNRVDAIIGNMYPVGSIYRTTSSADPGTTLGVGTWTRVTDYELVAYANLSSDTTIAASKNISSVVKLSDGHYRVNLSKNMSNNKYLVFVSGDSAAEGHEIIGIYDKNVNNFVYDFTDNTGAASTPGVVDIAVFGQLANPEFYTWKRTA